jgi:hypothetical protein
MQGMFRAGVFAAAMAAASTAAGQTTLHGWVDVNFGVAAAAQRTFTASTVITIDDEPADFGASYRLPSGASFDAGGGMMITPQFGLGISVSGTAHEDTADLNIRIPHPLFFNSFASDESPTEDALVRAEGGVHLQLMVVAYDRRNLRIRVFGGPSHFRVQQELVRDIRYNQTFGLFTTTNSVRISTFDSREEEGSAWGVHIGGDVSWFFHRVVGIGGFARFSRATVELEDPLDDSTIRLKAGGAQAGAGLRLRF